MTLRESVILVAVAIAPIEDRANGSDGIRGCMDVTKGLAYIYLYMFEVERIFLKKLVGEVCDHKCVITGRQIGALNLGFYCVVAAIW